MPSGLPLRRQGADTVPYDPSRPVPPAPMSLQRGGRPRKTWRYVGAYGADLMVCAATVRIGPFGQSFLAVWDRERGELVDAFSLRAATVDVSLGFVRARTRRVTLDLRTDEADSSSDPVEVVSPHGEHYIWTRKLPVRVRGTVSLDGVPRAFDAAGLIDDSAGYHARATDWEWSAGVGVDDAGRSIVWNLVHGVHDGVAASERTVWVDGRAHEVGPVEFLDGLAGCAFAEGGELRCAAEAERARDDNLLVISSRYRQPFGTFTGALPGTGALMEGYGVMEEHRARW